MVSEGGSLAVSVFSERREDAIQLQLRRLGGAYFVVSVSLQLERHHRMAILHLSEHPVQPYFI